MCAVLPLPQAVRFIPPSVMERAEYAADHFPIRLQDNWRAALVVLLVSADAHAGCKQGFAALGSQAQSRAPGSGLQRPQGTPTIRQMSGCAWLCTWLCCCSYRVHGAAVCPGKAAKTT